MSRNIDENILEQLRAGELTPIFLFEFSTGGVDYKYTSLDVSLTVTSGTVSGTFDARGFEFSNVHYSLNNIVDDATIRIDNRDQVLSSVFISGSIQGTDAYIYGAVLDVDGNIIETPINIFQGQIDSWELDEEEVNINLTTEFSKWSQKTWNLHSASCRWQKFKGVECQYAGAETWCDRSYTRCAALFNTTHFGGFRWLPDLENRIVWWGQRGAAE